jgi:hypothetical protein
MKSGLLDSLKRLGRRGGRPARAAEPRPEDPAAWLGLADQLAQARDRRGELDALRQAVELGSSPAFGDARTILRAARRLTGSDAEAAAKAWLSLLALDPHHVEAKTRLAEIELYDLGGSKGRARLTLAVIGNCQAYAVAACLRRLAPEADVRAMSVGELDSGDDAGPIAERFSAFDLVASQPLGSKYGALAYSALSRSARRIEPFPRIHFTGFHPDLLPAGAYPRGMHSKLVLAGYVMGLPQARVAELFNAYVYGVLGYFEEYAKSEQHHLDQARKIGFELEPLMKSWRTEGPFVHAHVHPARRVSWSIAERLAQSLGLPVASEEPDMDDLLEPLGVWPVYPEIARRLGVAGDLTFRFRDRPPLDLDAMIDQGFRACARLDADRISRSVAEVVDALRGEGI